MRSRIFNLGLLLALSGLLGSACVETVTLERDAGPDTGPAPTVDAAPGSDAGPPPDAGDGDSGQVDTDAGPAPEDALARFPWNGFTTGSPHVADDAPIVNHPLRPKLMWETSAGAAYYQVQMTRECGIEDFRACAFTDLELDEQSTETTFRSATSLPVSIAIPVGSRYFWRVRACSSGDVCSAFTEIRYLDVGRDESDFNGDGYADVLVGARWQSAPEEREGQAYVYFGGPTGVGLNPSVSLDNPLDQASAQFGFSVAALGDVNGDGYADLAVGAINQSSPEDGEGAVYLFFGAAGGPAVIPSLHLDNPADQVGGIFGSSVRGVGDLNGDGYADLATAAAGQDVPEVDEGAVYIFHGGREGPGASPNLEIQNSSNTVEGYFGWTLDGPGDVNGDGFVDLIVGARFDDLSGQTMARADLFLGSRSGLASSPDHSLEDVSDQLRANFAASVAAVGDLNGDGFTDVAVFAEGEIPPVVDGQGRVHLFLGSRTGVSNPPSLSIDPVMGNSVRAVGGAGDLNGDGHDDLLLGSPRAGVVGGDRGAVYLFLGVDALPTVASLISVSSPADQGSTGLGALVWGTGDLNGDGFSDFVAAAPLQDWPEVDEGVVHLFFGATAGPTPTSNVSLDNPNDQPGGHFGEGGL